ncbi:S-layer homology domain-containing protein [Oceanobacillus sp. CF4.6]|uniref:S-layer homology domain-containing protein n=1 Tax=Oceanobacillus sp. CF4.6 TaxID=3373080 RepID=UPI003EE53AB8
MINRISNNRISLISILFIAFVLLFTNSVSASAKFPDLEKVPWADNEILYLHGEEVVNGLPNGSFGVSDNITRADAALMLARAKGLDTENVSTTSKFPDVDQGAYYFEAVQASVEAGYLNGYPDGTFGAMDTLTREQMAKIIAVAYNFEADNGNYFNDISNSWAKSNINSIATKGISNGTGNGAFKPVSNISRAEFSVMLARAMNDEFKVEPEKNTMANFIDVGQGDSTLIQTPDGANILIDAGTKSAGQKVVSFLKSKDVGKLDLVVATHPHADHIGGLIPVLNEFPVSKFVDSGNAHTSQTYIDLLTIIDNKNIPFEIPSIGQVYSFDNNFKMTVLHVNSNVTNANDASIVLKADYNNVNFMLTGDAESNIENTLVNKFDLNSTILKAGHHGSNTSSSSAFINAVNPSATILSYGEGNSYGHPHAEVINRLQAIGSDIYSTAESGDISVLTNGITYSVSVKAWSPTIKPEPKPEPEPQPEPDPEPGISYPININKANTEQLEYITGVGPVIAQRIIDYRNTYGPFKKKEDIKKVSGIGNVTYEKMKNQITI